MFKKLRISRHYHAFYDLFTALCASETGCPSLGSALLIKLSPLQCLEEIQSHNVYRWFLGLTLVQQENSL